MHAKEVELMSIYVRKFEKKDLPEMIEIWNEIVEEGIAFPQVEILTADSGEKFFASQTYCAIAYDEDGTVCGLYILHPNNVGRCGHISNASYAVKSSARNMGIGELLVRDCIKKAAEFKFRILQFNAVVKTNISARHLYEKLGFKALGVIPGGFLKKDGFYEDIVPYYYELRKDDE